MRFFIVLLFVCCYAFAGEQGENILTSRNFPDPNFLEGIIQQYGDFMTIDEAGSKVFLDVSRNDVSDLTGLHLFYGLQYLDVGFNQLTELTDIDTLRHLKIIWATANQLTSLPNFTQFTQLSSLYASNNQLTSEALEDADFLLFVNAREIKLRNNALTYLPDFRYMEHLEVLDVANNELTTISGLAGNPNLLTHGWHKLDLGGNHLESNDVNCATISVYAQRAFDSEDNDQCPYFNYYGQSGATKTCDGPYTISDFFFFYTLKYNLGLDTNDDFFFCRHELAGIESLNLSGNFIRNIMGIELFPDLVSLNLSDNRIETLAPLLENETFVSQGSYLNVDNNLLGLDYPTRCELETLGWTVTNQRNDVDWVEDPCAGASLE